MEDEDVTQQDDDLFKQLSFNPYSKGVTLLAARMPRVRPPLPDEAGNATHFLTHAVSLWRYASQALNYWTPERIEQTALARASDSPQPSIVAQEVAAFTILFQAWLDALAEWLPRIPTDSGAAARRATFYRQVIRDTLQSLERRAETAEARATDLRLRSDAERVIAALRGQELASRVVELIDGATIASKAQAKEKVVGFETRHAALLADVKRLKSETDWIGGRVTEEFAKRELLTGAKWLERMQATAGRLVINATPGVLRDTFLHILG